MMLLMSWSYPGPMQSLTLQHSTITPGHAMHITVEKKLAAYDEECCLDGVNFMHSTGFGVFGDWGQDLINPVKAFGHLQVQLLGSHPSKAIQHLAWKYFFSLWNGKATLLTTRQRSCTASVDGIHWRYILYINLSLLLFVNVGVSGLFILFLFSPP